MSITNEALVTALCDSMLERDMDKLVGFLSDEVIYHNLPYDPVTGHDAVRKFLGAFVMSKHGGLEKIDYSHTLAKGNVVMNARDETWRYKDVTVVLPVAGVFEIENGLITKWSDYWDTGTLKPIQDLMSK